MKIGLKFKLIGVLLLFCFANVNAQLLQSDSLVGIWICREASVIDNINVPKEELGSLMKFKSAIISSKFIFKNNGLFELQFPKDAPVVFKELSFLNNKKWWISEKEGIVHIGPLNENLMQIHVGKKERMTYFVVTEIPLLLRMEKQSN